MDWCRTRDDQARTRMITDPLCLYDGDVPGRGRAAPVLTTTEQAQDLVDCPARVLAYAPQTARRAPVLRRSPCSTTTWPRAGPSRTRSDRGPASGPARSTWPSSTTGFSPSVYYCLEAAGLCAEGEASRFVADGGISPTGSLPVNSLRRQPLRGPATRHGPPHRGRPPGQRAGRHPPGGRCGDRRGPRRSPVRRRTPAWSRTCCARELETARPDTGRGRATAPHHSRSVARRSAQRLRSSRQAIQSFSRARS